MSDRHIASMLPLANENVLGDRHLSPAAAVFTKLILVPYSTICPHAFCGFQATLLPLRAVKTGSI